MRSRDHISRFSAFDWPLFVCRALDFEMDFVCRQCGQRFGTLPQLGLHTRVHHGHAVAPCPVGPGGCAPATQVEWPLPMLLPRLRPTTPADIVRRTAADIAFVSHPGRPLLAPNSAADTGLELRDYASLQIVSSQHLQILEALFSQEWWTMFESVRKESGATQVPRACEPCIFVCLSVH